MTLNNNGVPHWQQTLILLKRPTPRRTVASVLIFLATTIVAVLVDFGEKILVWHTLMIAFVSLLILSVWLPTGRRGIVLASGSFATITLGIIFAKPELTDIAVVSGLILLSAGIFPLTYLAYNETRLPARRQHIVENLQLLGLAAYDGPKTEIFESIHSPLQFIVFSSLIMLLVIGMDMVFLTYIGTPLFNNMFQSLLGEKNISLLLSAKIGLIISAFLGAYLFAIQELTRRYNTSDLLPQVYSSIFVRMVVATGIVAVAAALIGETASQGPLAFVLAFLIGTFPQRGMDWLKDKAKGAFDTRQRESAIRPLTDIIGINPWHEARLREMGIDDAQNLATVDIRRLLTTAFDVDEIVHWIDQAILYVKVGVLIETLRLNYIATFSELLAALGESPIVTVNSGQNPNAIGVVKENLMRELKLRDASELARVVDFQDYPNVVHVLEYYWRSKLPVTTKLTDKRIWDWENAQNLLLSRLPPQPAVVPQNGTEGEPSTELAKIE